MFRCVKCDARIKYTDDLFHITIDGVLCGVCRDCYRKIEGLE